MRPAMPRNAGRIPPRGARTDRGDTESPNVPVAWLYDDLNCARGQAENLIKPSALMRIDPSMLNETDPPTKSAMVEPNHAGSCAAVYA